MSHYQDQVEAMLRDGLSFAEIEDYINGLPLDDDRKSALWLVAWAEQPQAAQRKLARESLVALAG